MAGFAGSSKILLTINFLRHKCRNYSVLRLFTGLASAARSDW